MNDKTILVIASHPDDEILGCGGTIARLSEENNRVHLMILAEGLTSRQDRRDREEKNSEIDDLRLAAKKAAEIVGAQSIELLDFPDNRMDSVDMLDVIKTIEKKINTIKPEIIFTHFPGDLNIDHRITADAVITAIRPLPEQIVKEVYFFEVPSSTDYQVYSNFNTFQPNVYFSLDENQIAKKIQALGTYKSEMRAFPHSRSEENVRNLAAVRGASVGKIFAEAFMLGRSIR
jgi:LmbE family N-acetylglucosaminyl deacetylase